MIDREHDLPITKQADVLRISRGSVYYLPRPVSATDLEIMRRLDRLHLEFLRRLADVERPAGGRGVRDRPSACQNADAADGDRPSIVVRARPSLRPGTGSTRILLRGMQITQPQPGVGRWTSPTSRWRVASSIWLSCSMVQPPRAVVARIDHDGSGVLRRDTGGCFGSSRQARHLDQGSQFTGSVFTGVLANKDIAISMDGKGAWRDNVFVERLWRSVKYEEVYLRAYESVTEARGSIGRYLDFYNGRRPHSSLDGTTPDKAYFASLPLRLAA